MTKDAEQFMTYAKMMRTKRWQFKTFDVVMSEVALFIESDQ